jgi:hypothetical protein
MSVMVAPTPFKDAAKVSICLAISFAVHRQMIELAIPLANFFNRQLMTYRVWAASLIR